MIPAWIMIDGGYPKKRTSQSCKSFVSRFLLTSQMGEKRGRHEVHYFFKHLANWQGLTLPAEITKAFIISSSRVCADRSDSQDAYGQSKLRC
nr:hypothetical protein [Candidatus Cloacimonadota bacterium]